MFTAGLVSVTFRQLEPEAIIRLCRENRLEAIEWGGDIHVPHGETAVAAEVGRLTGEAGIRIAADGSYYRLGVATGGRQPEFSAVLDSAVALGAPLIRVWAGVRGSAEATEGDWQSVVDDLHRVAAMAGAVGLGIALEYHGNTLTDSAASASRLLGSVQDSNVTSLWQPLSICPPEQRASSLTAILGRVSNIHVYHWAAKGVRLPLADGSGPWAEYLRILAAEKTPRCLLLEFVVDNDPAGLRADAATLRRWITQWT